jgi:hypothetical protein
MLQLLSTTKQLTHSSSYHWHTFSDMVRLVSRSPCAMVTGNTFRQLAQLPSSFSTHHLSLLLCPSASAGPCNLQHSFLTSGLHQILRLAFAVQRPPVTQPSTVALSTPVSLSSSTARPVSLSQKTLRDSAHRAWPCIPHDPSLAPHAPTTPPRIFESTQTHGPSLAFAVKVAPRTSAKVDTRSLTHITRCHPAAY